MAQTTLPIAALFSIILLCVACDQARDKGKDATLASIKGCGPVLTHDRDWYSSGKEQPLLPGLSGIHFPITTTSEKAQRYFDQGLLLAYGFNHAEAARSFWQAAREDSTCAMAWWGFAYVLGPNYNMGMEPDSYARAYEAIGKAQALQGNCTEKEKGLIAAMAQRYGPDVLDDRSALDLAYSEALRPLAARYPDDPDIATLFAESLMDQHPWDLWEKDGREKPWTPEIISTLERGMKKFPEHPGAHHLYIHAVEASRTPERGLASAAFFADAVPGSGHLTHMPSHIYIRTGNYHDCTLANLRSIRIDSAYTAACHAQGVYPLAYFPHNIHFLSACAAMSGEKRLAWTAAIDLRDQLVRDLMADPDWATLQHYWAFPAMVAVKFGLWDELSAQPMPDSTWKYARALTHFALGVRDARTGNTSAGATHLDVLRTLAADAEVQEMRVWGINLATDVLSIADHVLDAELKAAEGDLVRAIALLTKAVEQEDALQYQEPPDWSFPVRHDLGALLLKAGRFLEAERCFRDDLNIWPENSDALKGLRSALEAQGKEREAAALQQRIENAVAYADREP